jgi:hypothetical protein
MTAGKQENDQDIRAVLKQSVPPAARPELSRDLWPQMLQRLTSESPAMRGLQVPWFDWVLAAGAGAALLVFPGIIPALFYHF